MWCYTLLPKILNMSLTAGIVIVLVLLARLPMKKAPKVFSYVLWAVVLFRLLCPVSFSSEFSLLGIFNSPTVTNGSITYVPADIVHAENPKVDLPLPGISQAINETLPQTVADSLEAPMAIATFLWLFGIAAMLTYSIVSVLILKKRLKNARNTEGNIYEADNLKTPFVLGIFKPKIFIPAGLTAEEKSYIIRHEQTHIRRFDHIVKPFAFLVLSIHWFNPLVWAAFVAMGTDMELSCDERVIKEMGGEIKKAYSTSLLSLATEKLILNGSPLAFGEGNVGGRIKNVLNYKKPTFWVLAVAIVVISILCVALISNPLQNGTKLMGSEYRVEKMLYNTPAARSMDTDKFFCITADYILYMRETANDEWVYVGPLEAYPLTVEELYGYCYDEDGWSSGYKVKEIADAYILRLDDDCFYLAVQTASGDTLLAHGWEDISERNQGDSDDTAIDLIFLLDSTLPGQGINADFLDRSLTASVGESVNCFSSFQNDDIPGYMIVGFIADGSAEKSDMGFATFRFKDGRYLLIDCNVYNDAAVTTIPSASDSTIHNGIHLSEDLAVCYQYGKPSEDVAYEIILSNNERLSAVTRVIDGKKEYTNTIDGNPSMSVFRRSSTDDEHEVSYELSYDGLDNEIIGDLQKRSDIDVTSGETQGSTEHGPASTPIEPTAAEWARDQTTGTELGFLDYASDDIVIFHGYYGLFVYDLNSQQLIRSLNLQVIGCEATQGDNYCEVSVSADGNTVQLHPTTSEGMYVYTVSDNTLIEMTYQPLEDQFDGLVSILDVMEFDVIGNCSIKAVRFTGNEYGYLRATDYETAQAEYQMLGDSAEVANISYIELNSAFLNAQAGILAGTLEDGVSCPVCGSKEHPAPAEISDEAPTEKAVETAKKKADNA